MCSGFEKIYLVVSFVQKNLLYNELNHIANSLEETMVVPRQLVIRGGPILDTGIIISGF